MRERIAPGTPQWPVELPRKDGDHRMGLTPRSARRWAKIVTFVIPLSALVCSVAILIAYGWSRESAVLAEMPTLTACGAALGTVTLATWRWSRSSSIVVGADPLRHEIEEALTRLGDQLGELVTEKITERGLRDPAPLLIRWKAVVEHDSTLSPHLLTVKTRVGSIESAADLYFPHSRVRSTARRLVVTGPPGSGKSALCLFLQEGLLKRWDPSAQDDLARVPVVLSLASWSTDTELHAWAARQIAKQFPWLGVPLAAGTRQTAAATLLSKGKILLILDAMDEIPERSLRAVLRTVNRLGSAIPVIVTCRSESYTQSMESAGFEEDREPGGTVLRRAAVIELLPPPPSDVARFLSQLGNAWRPVVQRLTTEPAGTLAEALSTPLMIWLASKSYGSAPQKLLEHIDSGQLSSAEEVERDLVRNLVPQLYAERKSSRWSAQRANRWLRFLARHALETDLAPFPGLTHQDIAWWTIADSRAARRATSGAAAITGALVGGGAVGLGAVCVLWHMMSHETAVLVGSALGLITGASMARICAVNSPPPTSKRLGRPLRWQSAAAGGLVVLVVESLAGTFATDRPTGLLLGVGVVPVAAAYAIATPDVYLIRSATALAVYRADVVQSAVFCGAYGISIGLITWLLYGPVLALGLGVLGGLAGGLVYGLIYKIAFEENISGMVAWLRFRFAHITLAIKGDLPWRLFAFLDDAYARGALRRNGATFQFRHILLRDELAAKSGSSDAPMAASERGRRSRPGSR